MTNTFTQSPKLDRKIIDSFEKSGVISVRTLSRYFYHVASTCLWKKLLPISALSIKPKNVKWREWYMKLKYSEVNIVVVGGGPIGMLTGIELTKLYPNKQIWILEKRQEYSRDQIIVLDEATLQTLPDEVFRELFGPNKPGCYTLSPNKDRKGTCYQQAGVFATIRISTLEKSLFNYIIEKTNILVVKPVNIEFTQLGKLSMNGISLTYEMLIGADGKNSQVRSDVLNATFDRTPFLTPAEYYGATFTLKTKGSKSVKHPNLEYLSEVESSTPQNIARFFKPQTEDTCYIGLIVNRLEYEAILQNKIPSTVNQRLQTTYLSFEQRRLDPNDLISYSAFRTDPMLSSKFYQDGDSPIFLIGDAAATTHFFTGEGLNFGVEMIYSLIYLLSHHPQGHMEEILWNKPLLELALFAAQSVSVLT